MEYKTLDMGGYKRKQHFEYFSGLAFPYVGTTAPVDITRSGRRSGASGCRFFSRSATARRGRRTACRSCAGAF